MDIAAGEEEDPALGPCHRLLFYLLTLNVNILGADLISHGCSSSRHARLANQRSFIQKSTEDNVGNDGRKKEIL